MGKTKTAFVGETVDEPKKPHVAKAMRGKEKPEKMKIAGLKGGQRIKVVEAAPTEEAPIAEVEKAEGPERVKRVERIRSKKYQESLAKVDKNKLYPIKDAVKLVKETSYSAFDGSVELHLVVKKTGTSASLTLPYSAGKTKKIEIANEETLKKLKAGKIDFDVLLATADMMPKLVPFAKTLGPKGLMPNPKNGTLIKNEKDVGKFSADSLSLKTEKEAPLIHTVVGKVSQKDEELIKNADAIFNALSGSKQILKAYAKATMGPSVKIQV
ncbi:hypothetical protein A2614_02610 [Candidatus Woesebacteria bacterium RIFOXYD1_FULL_40_21]|uniref:Large ribosomal subunit protein uL1 n=2 Tax=Candidatus Woeseibacteriota TaxID=1752722 RepID=A0A1F8DI61_9BACT|nr:MAG: hypothetical protein A2614_02610 [Candidatus Woesebacteria bacterium RIFOXYD1_FULL_40_21]